jgi:hypothetical protein
MVLDQPCLDSLRLLISIVSSLKVVLNNLLYVLEVTAKTLQRSGMKAIGQQSGPVTDLPILQRNGRIACQIAIKKGT